MQLNWHEAVKTQIVKRTERHKNWLGKNLPKSKQVRENQKHILALYTAIKCDSLLL